MATVVQFKRSSTEGAIPSGATLASGELAINDADGKVFLKKADNTVVPVSDWDYEVRYHNWFRETQAKQKEC